MVTHMHSALQLQTKHESLITITITISLVAKVSGVIEPHWEIL